ncbi:hypothetical protein HHI36_021025 [Cryptolaemus montrouzieri]|uniref:Uncharacterized protein n=1 Tax=Cryptolaemus montrouzieri TaxID=559131 RepID=A0ABD2MVZ5_9CUCU
MGVWILSIFISGAIMVHAIRVDEDRPKFLIVAAPQETQQQQYQANLDLPPHLEHSSSYYAFQANMEDGSHVDLNPNFNYEIYHPDEVSGRENEVREETHVPREDQRQHFLDSYEGRENPPPAVQQVPVPKYVPSNSHYLGFAVQGPSSQVTSYYSASQGNEQQQDYNSKLHARLNVSPQKQIATVPKKYINQKQVKISPKYTLSDLASKAEGTYKKFLADADVIYGRQEPDEGSKTSYQIYPEDSRQIFTPELRELIAKAQRLNPQDRQQNYAISRKDSATQPSELYEVDDYEEHQPEVEHQSLNHHSYPHIVTRHVTEKKKKEIHYHQHKHLHEHDHDQKHTHKHQAGHHHDHGHDHHQKHDHSHAHKDDHWHDHHEKNEHHHKDDHHHDHHALHDHKHHEDHGHKHHSYHHHGHQAHHDHDQHHDHKHGHKHNQDHDHHHGHDHHHKGKHHHDHHQSHKHEHGHHHKHIGKH